MNQWIERKTLCDIGQSPFSSFVSPGISIVSIHSFRLFIRLYTWRNQPRRSGDFNCISTSSKGAVHSI
jgi:hypothetical protein